MNDTPSALSVGQRDMHRGYSVSWIKGQKPCFILPHEGVAVISVGRNCPFYDKTLRSMAMTTRGSLNYAAYVSDWVMNRHPPVHFSVLAGPPKRACITPLSPGHLRKREAHRLVPDPVRRTLRGTRSLPV